ncbi:MAG: ribosome-binding factor A [Betaproteobacteria bacterium]|nr:ribosome-binding factor A [Betaproteobacteria bacterium]
MPHGFPRHLRIAALIRNAIAGEVGLLCRDGLLTVTHVQVGSDLSSATVFCTILGGDPNAAVAALERNQGKLRTCLSRSLRMRKVPQLKFVCASGGLDED